jgi:hypothetical protein
MKLRTVRLVLGPAMLVVLVALVGSLVCPPISERAEPPPDELVRPLADPVPAPLGPEEEAAAREVEARAEEYRVSLAVRDADSGLALAGAQVAFHGVAPDGRELDGTAALDAGGRAELVGLARGDYRLVARLEGWFPTEAAFTLPGFEAAELELALVPAATIRGELVGVDGSAVVTGLVQLTRGDGAAFHLCPVDPRSSSFASPPLEAGAWQVEYLERAGGRPAEGVSAALAVVPRQVLELRLTLPRRGAAPSEGRVTGVEVLR